MSLAHEQTDPRVCDLIADGFAQVALSAGLGAQQLIRLATHVCDQCAWEVEMVTVSQARNAARWAGVCSDYRARAAELREQERQTA